MTDSGQIQAGRGWRVLRELLILLLIAAVVGVGDRWVGRSASAGQVQTAAKRLTAGELPLWDAQSEAGMPLLGAGHASVFFPTMALHAWLGNGWGIWAIDSGIKMLAAMVGAWMLAGWFGITGWPRLLAGVGYGIAGCLPLLARIAPASVAAVLPWLCWTAMRLLQRVTLGRMVTVALMGALAIFGSSASALVVTGVMMAALAVWRPRRSLALVGALALGAMLGAIQLWPLGEYLAVAAQQPRGLPAALLSGGAWVGPALVAALLAASQYSRRRFWLAGALLVGMLVIIAAWPIAPPVLRASTWAANLSRRAGGRAWMTSRAQVLDRSEIERMMQNPADFQPTQVVLIDQQAENPFDEPVGSGRDVNRQWASQTATGGALPVVQYVMRSPEHVDVWIAGDGNGWLVVADTLYPGWQARLLSPQIQRRRETPYGMHTPIIPAFACMQTVFVPGNMERVAFTFDPASVRWGMFTSLAGLAALALLAGWGLSAPVLNRTKGMANAGELPINESYGEPGLA